MKKMITVTLFLLIISSMVFANGQSEKENDVTKQPTIHVFSKPNCELCIRAKSVLQQEGLEYIEHDVTQSASMAAASRYYSGSMALPQIFIGSQNINGAEDLEALKEAGLLGALVATAQGEISLDPTLEEQWIAGSEDFTIGINLDKIDINKALDDEEILVVSHYYKQLFGFTPIGYQYLSIWPEAYKACALNNVMATLPVLAINYGPDIPWAFTYATSSTKGCAYCTVHAASTTGMSQINAIKSLALARTNVRTSDNPYGDLELAMVDLIEQATLNKVTDEQVQKVKALAIDTSRDPQQVIGHAGLGSEIMGLLNIFNDMLNVEIEGGMADLALRELNLKSGRHAVTDQNPNDLNFELPHTDLTVEDVLASRAMRVGDWRDLSEQKLGYVPNWLEQWPEELQLLFTDMYIGLMDDSELSAELKQLMARTSAIAKGHEALAASAAISAYHTAEDKERAILRIQDCYAAATDQTETSLFTPAERLALRYAWLSAQMPIATPAQYVEPLFEHYSQRQIIELTVASGMAGAVQRMAATLQIQLSDDEVKFCQEHGIETDVLLLKYPLINL